MKYRFGAVLVLIAAASPAIAADMPPPSTGTFKAPPSSGSQAFYNWTGSYGGLNGGYDSGTSYMGGPAALGGTGDDFRVRGGFIGGTLGYNYQIGSMVFGLEGDLAYSMVNGTNSGVGPCPGCEVQNKYFGTVHGRLGYAFDRFLPYLLGGGVYAGLRINNPVTGLSQNFTRSAYSVGGGLEYAFRGNWTGKIEYIYNDYGMFDCSPPTCGGSSIGTRYIERLIRAGVNFKFAGPVFRP